MLKKHKLSISKVKQHNFWSGKDCPRRIRKEGRWVEFIQRVEKELEGKPRITNKERCTLKVKFTSSSRNLGEFKELLSDLSLKAEVVKGTSTEKISVAFVPNSVKYADVVQWLKENKISYTMK